MSDSDDQDKTRIQPRKRKLSARRAPASDVETVFDDDLQRPAPPRAPKKEVGVDATLYSEAPRRASGNQGGSRKADLMRASEPTEAIQSQAQQIKNKGKNLQAHDVLKGRFILERVLGAGGMGVVYKAKDLLKVEAKDRDPYVAIKVLGEEFKSHPEAFIALQRESRKTQRIAHPNIVNVYDFDKDSDTVFMTMEYLEGVPLDKLIKKYRTTGLPLSDVWRILDGLCSALSYAHDQHIIHSDLKPGNIFVTSNGVAKVFDFGIARAVAKAEQADAQEQERTVFDAGNLGALTPAYASLEMLEGDPPDVRDDIYALGCIAYQLFTGEHPFQRKNAKEAKRAGMKPRRFEDVSKHQWKVIEHALAFDREDRIGSVKEFWAGLTKKYSRPYGLWATLTMVLAIGGAAGYDQINRLLTPPAPVISETDVRQELELKIRLELIEKNLAALMQSPAFDNIWETAIWQELQEYAGLLGSDAEKVLQAKEAVYQSYLTEISSNIDAQEYQLASGLLDGARRYTDTFDELDRLANVIQSALLAEQQRADKQRNQEEQDRQRRLVEQRKREEEERKQREYDRALANIKEQLRCRSLLDMDDLGIAVDTLKRMNLALYKEEETQIVAGLAKCIQTIGRNFPDRAKQSLSAGLTLFDNHSLLQDVKLKKKDKCNESLAGFGARGRRSMCQDELANGGRGPAMVVIPGRGSLKPFAIGRYEVSIDEFNDFCLSTRVCSVVTNGSSLLPVTNLKYQTVQDYIKWLSEETGNTYRLPTIKEWSHAAQAKGKELDANRNCYLNSRGVQKGGVLISTSIGQQNGWGLINHVGNAGEWVTGEGGRIYAVGGTYKTDMDQCNYSWRKATDKSANPEVGFRLVRELVSNS